MSDKARDNLIKSRLFERDESGLRELEKLFSALRRYCTGSPLGQQRRRGMRQRHAPCRMERHTARRSRKSTRIPLPYRTAYRYLEIPPQHA